MPVTMSAVSRGQQQPSKGGLNKNEENNSIISIDPESPQNIKAPAVQKAIFDQLKKYSEQETFVDHIDSLK